MENVYRVPQKARKLRGEGVKWDLFEYGKNFILGTYRIIYYICLVNMFNAQVFFINKYNTTHDKITIPMN